MLDVRTYGIAHRADNGDVMIVRFDGPAGLAETPVDAEIAASLRIETGDVVVGTIVDGAVKLVESVNGLVGEESLDRPSPRVRGSYERSAPTRLLPLPSNPTGRFIELCAPMPIGVAGLIYGPHASGLTRCLQSVVAGALGVPDLETIVLLCRARGEEVTDWRRRFAGAEILAAPSREGDTSADQEALAADLVLAHAQRRTELGRHVLLAVDSLTAVWSAMLEMEDADAQYEADQSTARLRIVEWIQAAGWFGGEGLLGSGLGGSLTLVGTAWHVPVDAEAEEERESHPHLRLIEHVLGGLGWRVPLSAELADRRLYPAIDPIRCWSAGVVLLPDDARETMNEAWAELGHLSERERHAAVMSATSGG